MLIGEYCPHCPASKIERVATTTKADLVLFCSVGGKSRRLAQGPQITAIPKDNMHPRCPVVGYMALALRGQFVAADLGGIGDPKQRRDDGSSSDRHG